MLFTILTIFFLLFYIFQSLQEYFAKQQKRSTAIDALYRKSIESRRDKYQVLTEMLAHSLSDRVKTVDDI